VGPWAVCPLNTTGTFTVHNSHNFAQLSAQLYISSLNTGYLDLSHCSAYLKTSLVSRKELVVVMPPVSFVAPLITLYVDGGGYTANLCAIDLSKTFHKVNHYALKRFIPNKLLTLLEC